MKKINLRKIKREIKADKNTVKDKEWWLESIEVIGIGESDDYGRATIYKVVIGFPAGRLSDNGQQFEVFHFEESDSYAVHYEGTCFF